ncbi:MAG: hypothetical protein IPK58_24480 [Acidobacteria bacterium]|nr:hypothetical protein [Acidobacteriota bacterium]
MDDCQPRRGTFSIHRSLSRRQRPKKTRFAIATFGAIANYIDRAVTAFTLEQARVKREEEARRDTAKQAEIDRLREARAQRGYQLFHSLPEIDRQTLLGRKRAELITSEKWRNADFSTDIFKIMFEKEAEQLVRQKIF